MILVTAFLTRLIFLVGQPGLSPDVYRYRWDGRVGAAGINPYRYAPDDPTLAFLRDAGYQHVEHRSIRSVYPPWAQFLFMGWAENLLSWRLLILGFDLAAFLFLQRHGAGLAFAFCPLVLIEGVWNGHLDAITGALLLGSVLLVGERRALSGLLLGVATGIKFLPVAAAPLLLRRGGIRFLMAFLGILALPSFLFVPSIGGLGDYATRWSFNSPVYELTRSAIDVLNLDVLLRNVWTGIKNIPGLESISAFVYRQLYPELLARVFLAMAWIAAVGAILKRGGSVLSATGLLILFSPTIHPWYWLTILPLALAARSSFWLSLAMASPISYLFYIDDVAKGLIYAGCYGPAVGIAVNQAISALRERDISRWTALRGDSLS